MRFEFTDDQQAFADAVRDLLTNECDPATVRQAWENDDGRLPGLWAQLTEMGVVGMLAPEGVGGMGMSDVDLVAILAEAGRAALPEPLSATTAVAVPAIRDHAETSDAELWLERICAGDATIGVGLSWNTAVLHAATATGFLMEADDGLHLLDADVVHLTPVASIDGSRRLSTVEWHPSDATLLCGDADAIADTRSRAAIASAAEVCGLNDRMIELTVDYVTEREQFGVKIGTFQAIKHRLADALLVAEFAKPLVWRAAYAMTTGDPDRHVHASMAKAAASDAATEVSEHALQCHGAIGYTTECDLHLYMKRAWALAAADGDARLHRRQVAAAVI